MLILPVDTPQGIVFRARPHDAVTVYLLVLWTNSSKVYSIVNPMTYEDGFIYGSVSFPLAIGLENGSKINFRCFPVADEDELLAAMGDENPYISTIESINELILDEIDTDALLPEVYRGQIFVSNKTSQPYNVTQ